MFGLRDDDIDYIRRSLALFPSVETAVIFGSRAKGTHAPGSDVDIAVVGPDVNLDDVSRLHSRLEDESPMPYFFDVVDYYRIDNPPLKEHIDRVGVVFYRRGEPSRG